MREALDWADGKAILALDTKPGVSYEHVARAVNETHAMNRVIFITYSVAGAARLHHVAPDAMLFVTIRSASDLDDLVRRGVDLAHVVAWTGTDEPNSALNVALNRRGVEVEFGTLGGRSSWDARFASDDPSSTPPSPRPACSSSPPDAQARRLPTSTRATTFKATARCNA